MLLSSSMSCPPFLGYVRVWPAKEDLSADPVRPIFLADGALDPDSAGDRLGCGRECCEYIPCIRPRWSGSAMQMACQEHSPGNCGKANGKRKYGTMRLRVAVVQCAIPLQPLCAYPRATQLDKCPAISQLRPWIQTEPSEGSRKVSIWWILQEPETSTARMKGLR